MKAVDFIRKFGWGEAKIALFYCKTKSDGNLHYRNISVNVSTLKTYVDAWELVEKRGGLSEAKKDIIYAKYLGVNDMIFGTSLAELKQAIQLVEEVENENQD